MIAIVDYQMGNLRSVQKGFERLGFNATVTSDPAVLAKADKVVLPGVGACGDALHEIRARDLVKPITSAIDSGKPFLGICLGLQMLFETCYESGKHTGLGIIPGEVVRFDLGAGYKVPHMGWNQVDFIKRPPIFNGIEDEAYFYFVHSYYVVPADRSVVATETEYSQPFCSSIWRENLYATQFHPEKSQENGLAVLKNFALL